MVSDLGGWNDKEKLFSEIAAFPHGFRALCIYKRE
jgi:hypothetical protein